MTAFEPRLPAAEASRSRSLKIALVSEDPACVHLLHWLAGTPHEPVVVAATRPVSAQETGSPWTIAARMRLQTWPAAAVADAAFARVLRDLHVDVLLGVNAARELPAEVAAAPRIGAFNVHPGLLPESPGPDAASWAVYDGAPRHGVTIHHLDGSLDADPIAYQATFPLLPSDTAGSVQSRCVRASLQLTARLLEAALTGTVPAVPQDLSRRQPRRNGPPQEGNLRWDRPAEEVARFVRACDHLPFRSAWGHPRAQLFQRPIGIAKATVTGKPCDAAPGTIGVVDRHGVRIACADEWVCVQLVQIGTTVLPARKALVSGLRLRDGDAAPEPGPVEDLYPRSRTRRASA